MNKIRGCMLTTMFGSFVVYGSVMAADLGNLVHGPLATQDGQTLAFYQKDNTVTAYFTSEEDTGDQTPSDGEQLENKQYALGNVSIVAVFYQDLDRGGQDEVIVMYRDEAGKPHLRAWGADSESALPLTRFTPQLEKVAASLDKFTVANARKAIGRLLPQQYLVISFPQDLPDPLFTEVLASPDKYHSEFLRYFDEIGDDVKNMDDVNGYSIIFPDKFIERINNKNEKTRYTLTMDVLRQGSCGNDDSGFAISGLYYQNVMAEKDYRKDGPFVYFSQQGCQLVKNTLGQYHNSELDGEITNYSAEDGRLLEKGNYRDGKREGVWQEYTVDWQRQEGRYLDDERDGIWQTFSDTGEVVAVETWKNKALNGLWQRKAQQKGTDSSWVVEEEGQYLNGDKEGEWKEMMTTEPRYAKYHRGLLEGELRLTNLDGKNIFIKNYQHGLLNGEAKVWFDNGQLKRYANYLNGQLQGEEAYYEDNGQISELRHWKIISQTDDGLCNKLTDQDACDRRASNLPDSVKEGEWRSWHEDGVLSSLVNWRNGKKFGAEYKFNHSGKLFSYARWEEGQYPVEDTNYDYSSSDDYAHKPIRMRLSSYSHVLKDGLKEQSTFQSGENNLSRQNYWCTTSWNAGAVCGMEYWWHGSGFLASKVLQHNNRKIESTSWDNQGVIDRQIVKTSDGKFSDRFYYDGLLYSNTIILAKTYHDGNEDVVTADPSSTGVNYYYDKQGNEVSIEELRKQRESERFKRLSE
ncbi:toxin-antitoxin system YwqK family antitoxin [Citrobacter cronae]|uniref:toxin-antitoxin system YwqK family antitoxin n=1 Tax=Citrobacter cronae TaxID=1748967 RepID=UPI0021D04C4F|nr:hypothetical protein [Citrobacter cronae]MCU6176154.1 hypothetical protein [Citrobacter cronae]